MAQRRPCVCIRERELRIALFIIDLIWIPCTGIAASLTFVYQKEKYCFRLQFCCIFEEVVIAALVCVFCNKSSSSIPSVARVSECLSVLFVLSDVNLMRSFPVSNEESLTLSSSNFWASVYVGKCLGYRGFTVEFVCNIIILGYMNLIQISCINM